MASKNKNNIVANKNRIFDFFKLSSIILSIVVACTFFVYQMQGLPPRVTKLEQDLPIIKEQLKSEINELKSQIERNNVKIDIILDDVKAVKNLLMKHDK